MSRRELPWWTLPVSYAGLVAWAVVMALALAGCSAGEQGSTGPESAEVEPESTGPESMEFSELESGQKRWSWHDTDDPFLDVVVDHSTGVEYLIYDDGQSAGLCPLLDADGTPLLVAEAGE